MGPTRQTTRPQARRSDSTLTPMPTAQQRPQLDRRVHKPPGRDCRGRGGGQRRYRSLGSGRTYTPDGGTEIARPPSSSFPMWLCTAAFRAAIPPSSPAGDRPGPARPAATPASSAETSPTMTAGVCEHQRKQLPRRDQHGAGPSAVLDGFTVSGGHRSDLLRLRSGRTHGRQPDHRQLHVHGKLAGCPAAAPM